MLKSYRSEDDNFRSIQANGVAAQARKKLSRGTVLLTQDKGDNDSFVGCEDNENW